MGYYTLYSIHLIEGNKEDYDNLLKDVVEITTNHHIDEYGCFYEEMKWYDWESDCYKLSKEYPTLLFMVEGDGEYSDDFWRCYFQNGKSVYYEKEWPPFVKEDMK